MTEPILVLDRLSKAFGAVQAVDAVSLNVVDHEIHALIGPNGAGKSTLLSLAGGATRADSGRVVLAGEDISSLAMHARAKRGIGRSFQVTSIFDAFTVLDNAALAVQARVGAHGRFWQDAANNETLTGPAKSVLARVGLADKSDVVAGMLSHGEKRALELAMAIATRPRILLLDEPMAGVGSDERAQLGRLLSDLCCDQPILFVEHDMDVVFDLASRISVLAQGRLVASGSPATIRDHPEVQRLYLGEAA